MSSIVVRNAVLMNNPAKYSDEFKFTIKFDCLHELSEDLNWRLVYVGSSESEQHDQILEDVLVGPVVLGPNEFEFIAPAPEYESIPSDDVLGVTVVLLIASYKEREFIRVGWYVNNDYESQQDRENPPEKLAIERVMRNVLVEQPRVTTHSIDWS